MSDLPRRVEINIAAVPVHGVGGFLLCVATFIRLLSLREVQWFLAATLMAGVLFAWALIGYRLWRSANADTRAKTLFV